MKYTLEVPGTRCWKNLRWNKVEKKVDELKGERKIILKGAATFTAFMKDAIIPYNDAFGEYLETLINAEERKPKELKDHDQIENLQRQKEFS